MKLFDTLPPKLPPHDVEFKELHEKIMELNIYTVFGIPEHMIYAIGSNRDMVALDTRTGTIRGPYKVKL